MYTQRDVYRKYWTYCRCIDYEQKVDNAMAAIDVARILITDIICDIGNPDHEVFREFYDGLNTLTDAYEFFEEAKKTDKDRST